MKTKEELIEIANKIDKNINDIAKLSVNSKLNKTEKLALASSIVISQLTHSSLGFNYFEILGIIKMSEFCIKDKFENNIDINYDWYQGIA